MIYIVEGVFLILFGIFGVVVETQKVWRQWGTLGADGIRDTVIFYIMSLFCVAMGYACIVEGLK